MKSIATVSPDPFKIDRFFHEWKHGETVEDILTAVQPNRELWAGAHVFLGDIEVRPEYYHVVRPHQDTLISIRVLPQSGNGFWRAIAFIALSVAAYYTSGFVNPGWQEIAVQAAVMAIGTLAINALIPIPVPDLDNGDEKSQSLSVVGARNRLEPFGVLPTLLGTYKFTPPYAARPYTELKGDEQFVVMLFALGTKPMEIDKSATSLGNTPYTLYEDVELELLTGGSEDDSAITLYTGTVFEEIVGKTIPEYGYGYAEHASAADSDEITFEIHFPYGLIYYQSDGDKKKVTVVVRVEYSADGVSGWNGVVIPGVTSNGYITFTAKSVQPVRKGFRWIPPSTGKWYFRMSADKPNTKVKSIKERTFAVLRSKKYENAVNDPTVALAAMRIKATDQLNGVPDTVGFCGTSIVEDYNGTTWQHAPSQNPASLARFMLTGSPNARALGTNRLDPTSFNDFWTYCDTNNLAFNQYLDANSTIQSTLDNICRAAFSRVVQIDGVWKVITDQEQLVPRQIFTPRNSANFSVSKVFPDRIHAFRIRFIDEGPIGEPRYINDEQVVYADGYNVDNATLFESLEAIGITNWDQVWKFGRRYLAISQLQPELFSLTVDAEHLSTIVGDRVDLVQDSILVGLGAIRVIAIGNSAVILDSTVGMETGKNYAIQFRLPDGTAPIHTVATVPGSVNALTFDPILGAAPAAVGDLAVFGEFGQITQALVIKNIEPIDDLSAKLSCLPYAPGIYSSDTGTIPDYNPVITQPTGQTVPVISLIVSDEYVMWRDSAGNLQPHMVATLDFVNERRNVINISVQFRVYSDDPNNVDTWTSLPLLPADSGTFTIAEVTEGEQIEVRARFGFTDHTSGIWGYYYDSVEDTPYHTVIGKTTPPPDVDNFTVSAQSDGTREYVWSYNPETLIPPDILGYEIRFFDTDDESPPGTPPTWDQMTQLNDLLLTHTPFESNGPFIGDWYFAIKAIDTGGLYSENMKITPVINLPLPRVGDSLFYLDHNANQWLVGQTPGSQFTLCSVSPSSGYLIGDSVQTWANAGTWTAAGTWSGTPVSSGVEFYHTYDSGSSSFIVAFDETVSSLKVSSEVTAVSGGTYTYEANVNNTGWAAFDPSVDTLSSVDTVGFKLKVANIPSEGVRNWILTGFPG